MQLVLRPLRGQRRSVDVVRQLSDAILSGAIKPGERLPNAEELSRRLGVARTVVREALASLEALGVVQVYHGRGAFISDVPIALLTARLHQLDVSQSELLRSIWEVREAIETRIAALAAERRTPDDLERLAQACQEMEEAVKRGENGYAEDTKFHHELAVASHNTVLLRLVEDLDQLIRVTRLHALAHPSRPETSCEEHRAILERVEAQDGEGAWKVMLDHLAFGRELTASLESGTKESVNQ